MASKKHGHTHIRDGRTDNRSFLKNLDHMIGKIEAKLAATTSSRQALERDIRTLEGGINKSVSDAVDKALPDLEPRTIALLKRDYPMFLTRELNDAIARARTVRAPFWVWSGRKTYRDNEKRKVLGQIKVKLRGYIEATRPNTDRTSDQFREKSAEVRRLAQLEQELSKQLRGLQKARRVYGANDAPAPDPEFRSAVRNGSERLRSDHDRASSNDTFWRDIYISNVILDSVREQRRVEEAREERHHHDDDSSWNTPRRDSGSVWPTTVDDDRSFSRTSVPSTREDRGGGFEVDTSAPRSERGGGFEVSLDDRGNTDRGGGFEVTMSGRDDSRGAFS